jgi:hypothetical protein
VSTHEEQERASGAGYAGFAAYGACVVGIMGVVAAIGAFLTGSTDGTHYVGVGACLAAAGLSFGLLANAVLRR